MQSSDARELADAVARYVARKGLVPNHNGDLDTLAEDIEDLLTAMIDRRIAASKGGEG